MSANPVPTQMLCWIPSGRRFEFNDLVHWQGKGSHSFASVANCIDTIVLGPHASAAFPQELQPFVDSTLSRRKQFDFSDVLTGTLGRLWAEACPHTVFVENPHARLAFDANRPMPVDPMGDLRSFFVGLERQAVGEKVSFSGIDAIRPITFSGEQVLKKPINESQWLRLEQAMAVCRSQGIDRYRAISLDVVEQVLSANDGRPLLVISLHDTMNTKMQKDGAIALERPEADRLPKLANLGNRGDARGELVDPGDPVTCSAKVLQCLAAHWAQAFELEPSQTQEHITLNHPYKGAYETVFFGRLLASRRDTGSGAVQVEFLRESLMGPEELQCLKASGLDWPAPNLRVLGQLASNLAKAGQRMRQARHRSFLNGTES